MQPSFRLEVNGGDITRRIRDRMLEIRVSDEAGLTSDSLDIVLDDRDGALDLPPQGAEMRLWLGYASNGQAPLYMGRYLVDDVELSGPDGRMSVSGSAADMGSDLRSPKTRSWHGLTIGMIVSTIAAKHGLKAKVSPDFAQKLIKHMDQTEESDLAFLTRLATAVGAVAKPVDKTLVFVPESAGKRASGAPAPAFMMTPGDVTSWRASFSERGNYNSASGYWEAHFWGGRRTVTVGLGKPCYQEGKPFPDEATAREALTATLARLQRGKVAVDLTLPGRPDIFAEAGLTLSGFRPGVDGTFAIVKVGHTLSNSGLVTTLSAEATDIGAK